MQTVTAFFDSDGFMPHGMCLLWRPEIFWLKFTADLGISVAYLSIAFLLWRFVRRRKDLVFPQIFLMFGAFILLCGLTHAFQIWTLWNPDYPTEGLIKLTTAAVSLYTAFSCWKLMPQASALPSPTQFAALNAKLSAEIEEKSAAVSAAESLNNDLLTARLSLEQQAADLSQANTKLRTEIEEREKAEASLRQS